VAVDFKELRQRRIFELVMAYAAGGWAVLEVIDQVSDRGVLPGIVYRVALTLFVCGFPGALIVSWFHGAKGAQKAPTVEKVLLTVVAVLAVGAGTVVARSGTASAQAGHAVALKPNEDPRRVAVLYFTAEGGGDQAQLLATGLTESLIDELSTVKALTVVSRNGSELFRHQRPSLDSIGRVLKVGTLVDGRVAVADKRVRVTVSMISAKDGSQFDSRVFNSELADIFDLQDSVSLQVADFLRRKVGQEMGKIELRRTTHVVKAWELLQKASLAEDQADQALGRHDIGAASEELLLADSVLVQTEAADPTWVEPVVRRGWLAYSQSRLTGLDRPQYQKWIGTGLVFADSALARAPQDASALELKGTLLYWKFLLNLYDNSDEAQQAFAEAETLLRQAGTPSADATLSHLLMRKGETAQAKIAALNSYDGDPFLKSANLTLWRLTQASWDLGDEQETKRWCDEGLRRFPGYFRFHLCQVMWYALPNVPPDIPRAWKEMRRYVELSPPQDTLIDEKEGLQYVAMALVRAHLPDSARAVAVRGRASPQIDPTRNIAQLEAITRGWLGDWNEAVRLMGLYISANPSVVAAYRQWVTAGNSYWYQEGLNKQPGFRALLGMK
jgi:TolB-like protein